MYDHLDISDIPEEELPEIDLGEHDETNLERCQTKTIQKVPDMTTYRVSNGRLLKERSHWESVPEEKRPFSDCDHPFAKTIGSMKEVHDEWEDTNYHGIVQFVIPFSDNRSPNTQHEYVEFKAKFTDGELIEITEQ